MDYKSLKRDKILWTIVTIILIIFIGVVGYNIISGNSEAKNYDRTIKATRVEKNCSYSTNSNGNKVENCYPIYFYEVNGQTYNCKSNVVTSKPEGENHYVYYNSNNPSKCMNDTDSTTDSFGIIILIILISMFIFSLVELILTNQKFKMVSTLPLNKNKQEYDDAIYYTMTDSKIKIGNDILKAPVAVHITPEGEKFYLIGKLKYDTNDSNLTIDENIIDLNNPQNQHLDAKTAREIIDEQNIKTDNKIEMVVKSAEESVFKNDMFSLNQNLDSNFDIPGSQYNDNISGMVNNENQDQFENIIPNQESLEIIDDYKENTIPLPDLPIETYNENTTSKVSDVFETESTINSSIIEETIPAIFQSDIQKEEEPISEFEPVIPVESNVDLQQPEFVESSTPFENTSNLSEDTEVKVNNKNNVFDNTIEVEKLFDDMNNI